MSATFAELGLSEPIVSALATRGITEAFPIQELSIPDAIEGRDVCGKAKTGSGKTLAFGLPVLQQLEKADPKHPKALALVPTRELAVQVHDELEPIAARLERTIAAIYGGADIDKQIRKLVKGVDFVVATPGRLIDLIERGEVELDAVAHVIVDEADRMADMGFMPQVEWLLRHIPGEHQTLLFSATLDGVVDRLISRYQHDPARFEVESKTTTVDSISVSAICGTNTSLSHPGHGRSIGAGRCRGSPGRRFVNARLERWTSPRRMLGARWNSTLRPSSGWTSASSSAPTPTGSIG